MTAGDIPDGLRLCRAADWNQTAADWELFLRMSPKGCFVAVDGLGTVCGTVATVSYGDRFSWVGMVLVDPAYRRRGIGVQLLRESLGFLSEVDTVKLDATSAGRPIYIQLDFVDEYPIRRMESASIPENLLGESLARPMQSDDLPSVLDFDGGIFGAQREEVMHSIANRCPQLAWVVKNGEEVKGYCAGRIGFDFAHIGPVVADDADAARQVVSMALRNTAGRPVIIDAPVHTPEWIQWLISLGFTEQRAFTRMYRGANNHPGIPEKQFAFLGPEFG